MKSIRILQIILLITILLCACSASISTTPQAAIPTPGPITSTFEGVSSFKGGAGSYVISCENCTATVVSTIICQAYKHTDGINGTGEYSNVTPTITVTHDGEMLNSNAVSSPKANGSWTITNQSLEYKYDYGQPEHRVCNSDATFNVIMTEGGTVISFP